MRAAAARGNIDRMSCRHSRNVGVRWRLRRFRQCARARLSTSEHKRFCPSARFCRYARAVHCLDHLVGQRVCDTSSVHLGHEVHDISCAAVNFGVAGLGTKPLNSRHSSRRARPLRSVLHAHSYLELEWLIVAIMISPIIPLQMAVSPCVCLNKRPAGGPLKEGFIAN